MAAERDINLKIAKEVEKYPCLYNFKLADYARKDVTEKAWDEVSKKTNLSVHECKEKWKNVRSAFVRSLKPAPSGSSAKSKKPYYLHDILLFILPYVKPINTNESPGNIERPQNPTDSQEVHETEDNVIADVDEASSQLTAVPNDEQSVIIANTTVSTPSTTIPRKRKTNDLDKTFVEYLQNKKKNTTTTDDETAKRYFLLSLLPELRGLNEDQIRLFKIKVLLLIDNIKGTSTKGSAGSSYSSTSTPSPSSTPGSSYSYFARSDPQPLEPFQNSTETSNILSPTYTNLYSFGYDQET